MEDMGAALAIAAATAGFVHTLIGPDHYVPFVAMGKARGWSLRKTLGITTLCGLGHVLGSVLLGVLGLAFGWAIYAVQAVEAFRGDVAGWLLLSFGLVYLAWGVRRALRSRPHAHRHHHPDGIVHTHTHTHAKDHVHVHAEGGASMTPWVLFTVFIFGPCEPLIPLFMYPAARGTLADVLLVTAAFSLATLVTMLALVGLLLAGVRTVGLGRFAHWGHAAAGLIVALCGLATQIGL